MAASRSIWAGGRVTRAVTRKVRVAPAGKAVDQATRPALATPLSLVPATSRPADKVWVTSRCPAVTGPVLRRLTRYVSICPGRTATWPSLMLMASSGVPAARGVAGWPVAIAAGSAISPTARAANARAFASYRDIFTGNPLT
jgi:hypothetical protein